MPENKNAVIRYKYLDDMLRDKHNKYTRRRLYEKCNELLRNDGYREVSKRTIENDIVDLQNAPFSMEIEESDDHIIRYADQTTGLFARPFSKEEKQLLREVINTLGQVSGLENFTWVDDLQRKLNENPLGRMHMNRPEEQTRKILSFSTNEDYKGLSYLKPLFTHIVNKNVVEILYEPFDKPEQKIQLYPYLLKQYNDRWYLIGAPLENTEHPVQNPFCYNLALDRIKRVTVVPGVAFVECEEDLEERYEDIIGITLFNHQPLTDVILAVKDSYRNYMDTKPIHGSQTKLSPDRQRQLHEQYRNMEGHTFYRITVKPNYELKQSVFRNGGNMILVEPRSLREEMMAELSESLEKLKNMTCEK